MCSHMQDSRSPPKSQEGGGKEACSCPIPATAGECKARYHGQRDLAATI